MEEIRHLQAKAGEKRVQAELVEQAYIMFCLVMKYDLSTLEAIIDDLESEALGEMLLFLTTSVHYTPVFREMIKNEYWHYLNEE